MQINRDDDSRGTDTLQEGFVPLRIADDSYGSVEMKPRHALVAGSYVTIRFIFAVGQKGMNPGGVLRIGTPNTGWGKPLVPASRYWFDMQPPAYLRRNTSVELVTDGDAKFEAFVENKMLRYAPVGGAWRWWISVRIQNACLNEGDKIRVIYGDTLWGEPGAQVQKFLERDAYFEVLVDIKGNGGYVEIPQSPFKFDVIAGEPKQINVTIPSILQEGKQFPIRMALTDDFMNPVPATPQDRLSLNGGDGFQTSKKQISLSEFHTAAHEHEKASFSKLGLHRVEVISSDQTLRGKSNPAMVTEGAPEMQIYWGDMHAQSQYHGPGSWSIGTPDELYKYARRIAHLDFTAITDDAAPLSPGWQEIQQSAIDHYEPGKFVTFKAFEWCSKKYGHRNTIFADVEVEDQYPRGLFNGPIEDFWDFFRGKGVIMIPHHTLVWTDWEYHNPELEPLLEIYSIWGSSERPGNSLWNHSCVPSGGAQAALARGYRLGFIGSTDNHAGTPGRSVPKADRFDWQPWKGGLAAVYAPKLTREALFAALANRRTYGTTGARIILDFKINGQPMGSEIEWRGENVKLNVVVHGSSRIHKVDIIRNNKAIHCYEPDSYRTHTQYEDHSAGKEVFLEQNSGSVLYYYIRVTQVDGEMAWSSPIWLQYNDM